MALQWPITEPLASKGSTSKGQIGIPKENSKVGDQFILVIFNSYLPFEDINSLSECGGMAMANDKQDFEGSNKVCKIGTIASSAEETLDPGPGLIRVFTTCTPSYTLRLKGCTVDSAYNSHRFKGQPVIVET